jgi:hypothetical protein
MGKLFFMQRFPFSVGSQQCSTFAKVYINELHRKSGTLQSTSQAARIDSIMFCHIYSLWQVFSCVGAFCALAPSADQSLQLPVRMHHRHSANAEQYWALSLKIHALMKAFCCDMVGEERNQQLQYSFVADA